MNDYGLQHYAEMLAVLEASVSGGDGRSLTVPQKVEELRACGAPGVLLREWGINVELEYARQKVRKWLSCGYDITGILDPAYPSLLREVREAPAIIFTQGTLLGGERGVSVVGSRKSSPNQIEAARDVAFAMVEQGLTVVSGLARGIDTAAHQAALEAGGRTVAVVGSGLDVTYPPENANLRNEIVESGGLVLSQFYPEMKPSRASFPMRNSVMSGYGMATVVVSAEENSGTRHQARAAVKHGRSLIFTGKIAEEVSWARKYVDEGFAQVAYSSGEVQRIVQDIIERRNHEVSLF